MARYFYEVSLLSYIHKQPKMQLFEDSFYNKHLIELLNNLGVNGLQDFQNKLETVFLSDIAIDIDTTKPNETLLIINVESNYSLEETATFYNTNGWCRKENATKCNLFPFLDALEALKQQNSISIDIAELSINLKGTTLVVSRLYDQSIPEQIEKILTEVISSYMHISKGSTIIPSEIFVSVFEGDTSDNQITLSNIRTNTNDYFSFWGLYNDNEEEASIYDVRNKTIIGGSTLYTLAE